MSVIGPRPQLVRDMVFMTDEQRKRHTAKPGLSGLAQTRGNFYTRSYLREKKIKRQIILVTHNPNVVVGADAEEIIVANQQGIGNMNPDGIKFAYITGALEDSFVAENESVLMKQGIREHVCDLLEGGDKAFQLREQKYQLSSR